MSYFSEVSVEEAVAPRKSSILWLDTHQRWHEGDGIGVEDNTGQEVSNCFLLLTYVTLKGTLHEGSQGCRKSL